MSRDVVFYEDQFPLLSLQSTEVTNCFSQPINIGAYYDDISLPSSIDFPIPTASSDEAPDLDNTNHVENVSSVPMQDTIIVSVFANSPPMAHKSSHTRKPLTHLQDYVCSTLP